MDYRYVTRNKQNKQEKKKSAMMCMEAKVNQMEIVTQRLKIDIEKS